jgi:hypothetical protein
MDSPLVGQTLTFGAGFTVVQLGASTTLSVDVTKAPLIGLLVTQIAALTTRLATVEGLLAVGGGTGGGTTTQAGLLNPDGTGALNPDGTGALAPTGS